MIRDAIATFLRTLADRIEAQPKRGRVYLSPLTLRIKHEVTAAEMDACVRQASDSLRAELARREERGAA